MKNQFYLIYLFQLAIVLTAVFSIIVLRMVLSTSMLDATHEEGEQEETFLGSYAKLIGLGMAATINAIGNNNVLPHNMDQKI